MTSENTPGPLPAIPRQRTAPEAAITGPAFRYDAAVIGLGPDGLPLALGVFASGRRVLALDTDPDVVVALRHLRGGMTGADLELLRSAAGDPRFVLASDPAELARAQTILISAPSAAASAVEAAVPGQLLILCGRGRTEQLLTIPLAARGLFPGVDVSVAFSDGHRIAGGVTRDCTREAAKFLGATEELTSPAAAELATLTVRAAAAVTSAFAAEVADAAHAAGLDPAEVLRAAGTVPHGAAPLAWPLPAPLIAVALAHLDRRPEAIVGRAAALLAGDALDIAGARILVVGVTHTPGHADATDSPAIEIMQGLLDAGAAVAYHDPLAPRIVLPGGRTFHSCTAPEDLGAELVLIHTIQPGMDLGWLDDSHLVLDTTYCLGGPFRHPVL
ncbi:MAG: putative UDP-glucose dehydrogenase [Actinomycetia bacterium]|nr:putative UDP-glucose dehydrogenase [Actinomycetes bacterium]